MNSIADRPCTAFEGHSQVAAGPLKDVVATVWRRVHRSADGPGQADAPWVFDDTTGQMVELNLRGTLDNALQQMDWLSSDAQEIAHVPDAAQPPEGTARRSPGRPRLGVVSREVTLLPRHWDWLALQPGGASVALRKLVEEARRTYAEKDRTRQAQEVCYRFMQAAAGQQPGYEEALRALFAQDAKGFEARLLGWPADLAGYAHRLAAPAFRCCLL